MNRFVPEMCHFDESGPFDFIGDIHGCFDELETLMTRLGYEAKRCSDLVGYGYKVTAPEGRRAIFLGDLVDRGPRIVDVLKLVMSATTAGVGLCLPGNHDLKLMRKLRGRPVKIAHGLAESLEQLDHESRDFKEEVAVFLDSLLSHFVLDNGNLVAAHAGMKEEYQGENSDKVMQFALYGETTGETDEYGLPVRLDWAAKYKGEATVVYGHTPVSSPRWVNRTINIDTGCVFGGNLTALRYPEMELVSVPAARVYCQSAKPFPTQTAEQGDRA